MKHILFIGDLRTVKNYGAVATTESLLKLLKEEHVDAEYKYIDFRSLYNPTPVGGWPEIKKTTTWKRVVKRFLPLFLIGYVRRIRKGTSSALSKASMDFVPYKFSQYEDYYDKMRNGYILQYEKNLLDWADIVYVNGEGNIVNGTDRHGKYRMGARYILFMLWVSKVKCAKPTLIVNHTVDPNNYNAFEMISEVYPKLDKVLVREPLSIPILEAHGVHNAIYVPDALFSYIPKKDWRPSEALKSQIDFSKPYICLGDSSGIKNNYGHVSWDVVTVFTDIINNLRTITPQIVLIDGFNGSNRDINKVVEENGIGCVKFSNCSYQDLCQVLSKAQLFISGRWHASILSTIAKTPVLLWGSDSHKTKSLYTLLDYPYRFFEVSSLPANIPELVAEARKIIEDSSAIRNIMSNKVGLYKEETKKNALVLNEFIK